MRRNNMKGWLRGKRKYSRYKVYDNSILSMTCLHLFLSCAALAVSSLAVSSCTLFLPPRSSLSHRCYNPLTSYSYHFNRLLLRLYTLCDLQIIWLAKLLSKSLVVSCHSYQKHDITSHAYTYITRMEAVGMLT